uniref:Orf101 n=1 Tax=Ochromonas danica TaxID=2986 RepID=Q9G911_OCHDN|nr:orf101 [Ochromonas danica]AAG18394.1 orf101 [Ochromonas danica]
MSTIKNLILKYCISWLVYFVIKIYNCPNELLFCICSYLVFHVLTMCYQFGGRSFVEDIKNHRGILLFYFFLSICVIAYPILVIKFFGVYIVDMLKIYSGKF